MIKGFQECIKMGTMVRYLMRLVMYIIQTLSKFMMEPMKTFMMKTCIDVCSI